MIQLGEVCEFVYGEAMKEEKRESGKIPVFGSNGVVGWHNKAITAGPTIVIGRKGSIGEVNWSGGPCFPIDTTYYVEKTKKPCDLRWLYFTLLKLDLTRLNKSAAVPGLNRDDAYRQLIPFPNLNAQQRIVQQLEEAHRLRRMRGYALELTDNFLRSVFSEVFAEYLNKEPTELFKNMLALPLSNGSFETNEMYGSGTPVIWVDNLYHTISIDLSKLRRAKLSEQALKKYAVAIDDLLFTRSSLVREGVGQINIVPKLREKTAFECHIIRARIDRAKVNPFYILGLYRSFYGKSRIMQRANTATMTTISQTAIEELPCPIPPRELQDQFEKTVSRFERLRARQCEAERQAGHLFQTLLHRAFAAQE